MKKSLPLTIICAFFLFCYWPDLVNSSEGNAKIKSAVTFAKDITPILRERCEQCHHKNGIAPMSLVNYEEVRPWARAIKEKVVNREMPPFFAGGPVGYYQDDERLTDDQIALISAWVDADAPKGDTRGLFAQRDWPTDWQLGKPDLVLTMPQPYTVKADNVDDYQLVVFEYTFPEDTWVRGIEIRPGNRRAVHHATLYTLPETYKAGPDGRVEGADLLVKGGSVFSNWVPGSLPRAFEDGFASLIKKGTRFGIQLHYAPTDKPIQDQTSVGFYYANGIIKKRNHVLYGATDVIEIPPGEANYQIVRMRKFTTDALIKGFTIHMHLRGKSYAVRLHYPDGRVEKVFDIPRYNFNWQRFYKLAKPIMVPKGTVAEYIADYDNSARNKYNPDPTQFVRFGGKTTDEMMTGTIQYEIPGENLNTHVKNGRRVFAGGTADAER